MDVHIKSPHNYRAFIDMLQENINTTREFADLYKAYNSRVQQTSGNTAGTPHPQTPPATAVTEAPSLGTRAPPVHNPYASPATALDPGTRSPAAGLSPEQKKLLLSKATSPQATPAASSVATPGGSKQPVQVIVARTRSNDMVIKLVKRGGPCYTTHIETYLKNNPTFAKDDLKVDKFTCLVDPNNRFTQFGSPNSNGYVRRILVLVHTMTGPHQFALNNAHNRARWANTIVKFYNEPSTQAEMRYAELAHFAGDVTPQDEDTCAPLSHWLTAQETVDYIVQTISSCNDFSAALSNDHIMGLYFNQQDIPAVRAQLSPDTQGSNRRLAPSDALDF
jgi:hypothetical protein